MDLAASDLDRPSRLKVTGRRPDAVGCGSGFDGIERVVHL
jgi:hypothetical protein